ncbi:uncharacterized protein [Littorina saxatilis]|uniref:PID domain-containing protein n=1 Tax=Littorina saxatilis TaxID=31220 RepID=A0AAN9AJB1_9CAEN
MVQEKELIRKRVLYIGSAVPLESADGLDGVQKPLLERYPVDDDAAVQGVLAFLSIVPSGITLQYVSDPGRILFFPISSLTLCAAVRCVTKVNGSTGERTHQFMSLSSPQAGGTNAKRPAIFTTITRRTEGRKILECHGFICTSSKDALELVQVTSYADRVIKGKINGATPPPPAVVHHHHHSHPSHSHNHEPLSMSPRSFETNTMRSAASTSGISTRASPPVAGPEGEHPVRLVAGLTVSGASMSTDKTSQRVAPEFYEAPPRHGYFYKTPDTQIKTYTVERVMDGEKERLTAISPNAMSPRPGSDRRSMYEGTLSPPPHHPVSGAMTLPHPPGRTLIPVRAMPPSAAVIRPRFFSPPPPLLRPRPMMVPQHPMMAGRGGDPYVFLPPPHPPHMVDAPYVIRRRPPRRSSDSSSRGSTGSSSPPGSPREMNGRRMVNGDGADGSSDVSSRPHTPPTDYERGGPRVSRKEQFDRSQRHIKEMNGGPLPPHLSYATLPGGPLPPQPPPGYPYDYYVYPTRYPYGPVAYPPFMMERARSVPPQANRGKSHDRKKNRKGKKEKKKSDKRMYGVPSDISTDSVGYTSEVAPGGEYPRMPRDFRRLENQFRHERAFSKSLAEEGSRGGPEHMANAYSLNEHMAQRGGGTETDGFTMY